MPAFKSFRKSIDVAEYGGGLAPEAPNPEDAVKELVGFLPVLAYDGSHMTQVDAGQILDRAAATAAWPALLAQLPGAQVLDVAAVQRLDSAGLALLAEAADRLSAQGAAVQVTGAPEGLAELRAAYRLDAALGFADPSP